MRNGDITVTGKCQAASCDDSSRGEDLHLEREHKLIRVAAWVSNAGGAARRAEPQRSATAERMARCRAKKAAAGLVKFDVPAEIAARVKAAGGWEAWLNAAMRRKDSDGVLIAKEDLVALEIGRRVMQLRGIRARLMEWVLGDRRLRARTAIRHRT